MFYLYSYYLFIFSYLDGIVTIVLVCLVESVVNVRLSVHCITTSSPLGKVDVSPFLGLRPEHLVAAGIFFLLTITVPVSVVPTRRSSGGLYKSDLCRDRTPSAEVGPSA